MKRIVLNEVKKEDLVESENYLISFPDSPQLSPALYSGGSWIFSTGSDSALGDEVAIFEYPYVRKIEE